MAEHEGEAMRDSVMMGGWVNVENGCPIDSHVFERSVEFRFGGPFGDFTLVVERDALRVLCEATGTAMTHAPAADPETDSGMDVDNADDAA
jgi:hypothetical protein